MDDNSKRLGALFWKLNERQVSGHVAAKLLQLCAALDAGNWAAAAQVQVRLARVLLAQAAGCCGTLSC